MATTQERLDSLKAVNDQLLLANGLLAESNSEHIRTAIAEVIGAQLALVNWAAELEGTLMKHGVIDK